MSTATQPALRPDLTRPIPKRIAKLPVSDAGYPVPWFVRWIDGKPEFRSMDSRKVVAAINEKVCWVCGQPRDKDVTFVIGPMCGINRVSAEPPCHFECAQWSARNCPFLVNPNRDRREDETFQKLREHAPQPPVT